MKATRDNKIYLLSSTISLFLFVLHSCTHKISTWNDSLVNSFAKGCQIQFKITLGNENHIKGEIKFTEIL